MLTSLIHLDSSATGSTTVAATDTCVAAPIVDVVGGYCIPDSVVIVVWMDCCRGTIATQDGEGVPVEAIDGAPPSRDRVRQRSREAIAIILPTGGVHFSSSILKVQVINMGL